MIEGLRQMGAGLSRLAEQLRYVPRTQDLGTPFYAGTPAAGTPALGTPFCAPPNFSQLSPTSDDRNPSSLSAPPFPSLKPLESPLSGADSVIGDSFDDPTTPTAPPQLEKQKPEPPYHIFTLRQKKLLVYIVSLAGLFSPLSSNIYFPALDTIAKVRRARLRTANPYFENMRLTTGRRNSTSASPCCLSP